MSEFSDVRWYLQAKETKCAGKGGRESEHLIVPLKWGNHALWDPVEGRGCRIMELQEGKMSETLSSVNVSTKLLKVAELGRSESMMRGAGCVNRARPVMECTP